MALRENLEKEKKKLQRLSFREKLQYIFDYYKFWFLGIAAFLGLVWAVGSTMLHNKPTGFYAMLLNAGGSDLSGEADQAASAAFAAAAGLNDENEKIIVDTSATFNPNDQSQFSMAQNAKIGALYQSHDLDVMVADPGVFTYYALNGSFMDLRDVLDDATLSDYEAAGKLYYIDQHVQELLDQTDYGDLEDVSLGADETIANSDTLKQTAASSGGPDEADAAEAPTADGNATEKETKEENAVETGSSNASTTGEETDTSETLDEMSAFAANLMGLTTVQPREDFVLPDPDKMQTPIPVGIVLEDAAWLEEQKLYQNTTPIFGFATQSERTEAAKQFLQFLTK